MRGVNRKENIFYTLDVVTLRARKESPNYMQTSANLYHYDFVQTYTLPLYFIKAE
jgi:hypothetical protein